MTDNQLKKPDSRDLRDSEVWEMWKKLLPDDEKEIVMKAAMAYVESDDTMILVFPHSCQEELGAEGFSRLVDAIRAFYDSNRQRWMGNINNLANPGQPPRDSVIPNIVVEIAQPRSMIH